MALRQTDQFRTCESTTASTFKTEIVKTTDVIAAVAWTNAAVCGST
jgi:hypothetical protein